MAMDLRRDPRTWNGALERVGEQLAVHPETLRNWVAQAEVDAGERPGTTTSDAQRLAEASGRTGDRGARTRSCQRVGFLRGGAPPSITVIGWSSRHRGPRSATRARSRAVPGTPG